MYYNTHNGLYVDPSKSFVYGDVQYPAGWFGLATQEEKEALGFVEVTTVGVMEDEQYYYNNDIINEGVRTITPTPKSVDQIRPLKIQQAKIDYDAALSLPLEVTAGLKTFKMDITEKAQLDWTKLMMFNIDVVIRDADNTIGGIALTANEFKLACQQVFSHIQALWSIRCSKIDQLTICNSFDEMVIL